MDKTNFFSQNKKYIFWLIIIISIGFATLEAKKPYYFLQDDNRTGLLPFEIHSYKSLVEDKEIAFYNFHQFLGNPHFSHARYDLYFPIHFAAFLSKSIFGHYFATMDIIVFLQFIIGAIGFYYLLTFFEFRKEIAFLGAITWVFNSFTIYISNSWWLFSCTTAYFPWMIFFTFKLFQKPEKKYLIGLIIAKLLLILNSYYQNIAYAFIFEFLTILFIFLGNYLTSQKGFKVKSVIFYGMSYVFVFFLSLPLVLPFWNALKISYDRAGAYDLQRFSNFSFTIFSWLKGLVYPYTGSSHYIYPNTHYVSHVGYLTVIFLLMGIFLIFRKNIEKKYFVYLIAFIILAGIGFLWCTGILNRIIYLIPLLNRMRWPFKLNIFTNFYLILVASFGLNYFAKTIQLNSQKIRYILVAIILIQFANFLFLYTFFPQKCLNFAVHKEKPPLKEPYKEQLKEGRILSLGLDKSNAFSHKYLGFNYATLWELYHFYGNDGFISQTHKNFGIGMMRYYAQYYIKAFPIDYFRYWGIKWYVLTSNEADSTSVEYEIYYAPVLDSLGIELKFEDDTRKIYYDEKAKPMMYWAKDESTKGINYQINTNSIDITTKKYLSSDVLMINFLYDPWFTAKIDGKEAELLHKDGQMAIKIPPGKHKIEIRYSDPYFKWGIYIMSTFLLVFLAGYLIHHYRKKARK